MPESGVLIRSLGNLPVTAAGSNPGSSADPAVEAMKQVALQRMLESGLDRPSAEAELTRADRATWGIGLAENRREFWQAYSEHFATGEAGKIFVELADGGKYNVEWAGKLAHAIADSDSSTTLEQRRNFFAEHASGPVCQFHGNKVAAMELFRQEAARTDPARAASTVGGFLKEVGRPEECERALKDYAPLALAEPERRARYNDLRARGYSGDWLSRMMLELDKPMGDTTREERDALMSDLEKLPSLQQHQSKLDSLQLVADRMQNGQDFQTARQQVMDYLSRSGPLGGRPVDFREFRLHESERQEVYLKCLEVGMSGLFAGQATDKLCNQPSSIPATKKVEALGELMKSHGPALQVHKNKLAALDAMSGRVEQGQSVETARDEVNNLLSRMPAAAPAAVESALTASTTPTPEPVLERFSQFLQQGLSAQAAAQGLSQFSQQGREKVPGAAPAYADLMRDRSDPQEVGAMASGFDNLLGRGVKPERAADLLERNQDAVVAGHLDSVLEQLQPDDRNPVIREGPGFVDVANVRVRTRISYGQR